MSTIASQIANACYLAIALHFIRSIVNKKSVEDPALDALKNLPEEARMKIYSDAYANPEGALVGYKGKVTDEARIKLYSDIYAKTDVALVTYKGKPYRGGIVNTGVIMMPYLSQYLPKPKIAKKGYQDDQGRNKAKVRDNRVRTLPSFP